MKYILIITLALFVSMNVSAEEITEQDYLNEAKKWADYVLVSKFRLANGKYGYNLVLAGRYHMYGSIEAKASELCGTKGYVVIREESIGVDNRRQIIQCNQ